MSMDHALRRPHGTKRYQNHHAAASIVCRCGALHFHQIIWTYLHIFAGLKDVPLVHTCVRYCAVVVNDKWGRWVMGLA